MSLPLINITKKQAYCFAVFLVLYEFLTYIANDMIMPAMIQVTASFHADEAAIATSLTAYILGGASLQLLLGPLSDRYGRRPVMIAGACFFLMCTFFIACSHTIDQFLIARFFQGMGLCFIGVIGYATLQEIFSEMEAVRLVSIMSNVSILAPLIGPLVGAVFIYYLSWRFIFIIIGVFAGLALWGLWRFMPEPVGQTTREGKEIKVVSLTPRVIASNYKQLLTNRPFMWASVALGLLSMPCVAWIGLSPVMLVIDAKLTMMAYGVWQLPVFGACILGNVVLQRMTHHASIQQLSWIGSGLAVLGLVMTFALPAWRGGDFIWLMPGLILYFFGYGIVGAPLNRFALFVTTVSKGTASALISLFTMMIQGAGVELANVLYASHSNLLFGGLCAAIGVLYLVCLKCAFYGLDSYKKGLL